MFKHLRRLGDQVRLKIHSFALGTTLALAVVLAGQLGGSCALTGQ